MSFDMGSIIHAKQPYNGYNNVAGSDYLGHERTTYSVDFFDKGVILAKRFGWGASHGDSLLVGR